MPEYSLKRYPVDWMPLFKNLLLTFYIIFGSLLVFTFIFAGGARLIKMDFNVTKAFEHISLPGIALFILVYLAVVPLFAFIIANAIRLLSVHVKDGYLCGCSVFLPFQKIKISEIIEVGFWSQNGINAYRAMTSNKKQILFSTYTKNVEELLEYIIKHSKIETRSHS